MINQKRVREVIEEYFKTMDVQSADRSSQGGYGYHFYICSRRLRGKEFRGLTLKDYSEAFTDVTERRNM